MRQVPSLASSARVVLVRMSLPPCFSVIPMPTVTPFLAVNGRFEESYNRDRILGSQTLARSGAWASAATAALVMVIGQTWPHSACAVM